MRTTVSIADELLAAARARAQRSGQTLGAFIEAALRRELAAPGATEALPEVPVFRGGTGPRPGLDLNSNRALAEALDEDQPLEQRR